MPGRWLTINEIAEQIGVTTKTVHNLIDRGELPASKIGQTRMVRVAADDVDALMRRVPAGQNGRDDD
jgi:excisionase family DNA binding protein